MSENTPRHLETSAQSLQTNKHVNQGTNGQIALVTTSVPVNAKIQNNNSLLKNENVLNYWYSNEDEDFFLLDDKYWDFLDAQLKEFACSKHHNAITTKPEYKNEDKVIQFPPNLEATSKYFKIYNSTKLKDNWYWPFHHKEHLAKLTLEQNYSRLILRKLINVGMLQDVDKVISTGNNSIILRATFNCDSTFSNVKGLKQCVIKVFKTKLVETVSGDGFINPEYKYKELFIYNNTRQLIKQWTRNEYDILVKLKEIGINSPTPLYMRSHCIVMTLFGDNESALSLASLVLPEEKWEYIYTLVLQAVNKLYTLGGYVHGDLNERNILWWKKKIWFIDFSLAVPRHSIHAIELLRRDCKNMTKLTKSTSNVLENAKTRDTLLRLLREYEKYSAEVKQYRSNINQMDFLLKQVQKEIKKMRSKGTSYEKALDTLSNQTIVSQLENRLNTAMTKFNSVNSENYIMRLHIDRLLCDRQFFNTLWKNQVRRLMEGKAQILELVEQAINTYDQREELCAKLDALKEKAAMDYRRHCLEVRELQRQLEHSMKLEQFLRCKGTVRVTAHDARAEARRLHAHELEMRTYNNYVNILDAVKEYMGEDDVDKLIQEFTRREEENYALFNYINEVNTELKNLSDNVKSLKANIEEEHAKHQAKLYKQQVSVESLRSTLDEKEESRKELDETCDKTTVVLDGLLEQIQCLANSSQCDSLPLLRLLGQSLSINMTNARLFIKSLEKKITEIVDIIKIEEKFLESQNKERTAGKRRAPRTPRAHRAAHAQRPVD